MQNRDELRQKPGSGSLIPATPEAGSAKNIAEAVLPPIESALKNRELKMYLQPKVEITTGRITAAEALVRWCCADGSVIMPSLFIPILEQKKLIRQLDEYMFRQACAYQSRQLAAGRTMIPISVNLSRGSLQSSGIVDAFRRLAEEYSVPLSTLPLEITESALISDEQIQKVCSEFVQAGFQLQIDDFGSGYSSMSSLATLPFSELKIDKSLIDHIGTEKGNIIIQRTVQIAQDLGMTVIAEGVEHEEQVKFLQEVDCNLTQGFYYAAPMTALEFEKLLAMPEHYENKNSQSDGIPRMTAAEFRHYLRAMQSVFCCIRILKPEQNAYVPVGIKGSFGKKESPCYAIWGHHDSCENCTTQRAFAQRETQHKLETVGERSYLLYSVYLEVDGEPRVIELVCPLES